VRLTAKIVATLVIGLGLVLALFTRGQIDEATDRFERDIQDDAKSVGRLLRPNIARTWRLEGKMAALYLIQYTNETLKSANVETKMRVRWVWLELPMPESNQPTVAIEQLGPALVGREQSIFSAADKRIYTYVPVNVGIDGAPRGALEISESTVPIEEFRDRVRGEFIKAVLVLASVCAALILLVGTWFVGRPLRKLANAADRIGAGEMHVRVHLRQKDEVGKLARTMNQTARRLEKAWADIAAETDSRIKAVEQLRHADRLSSVGAFAAGVAHELGTPLAVVSGRARLIADDTATGDVVTAHANSIAKQADKMAVIIRRLLDFARRRRVSSAGLDLGELAAATLPMLQPIASKRRVELDLVRPPQPVQVSGDSALMQQVLTNLIMNAIDATDAAGGRVTIEVGSEQASPPAGTAATAGAFAFCRVRDRGRGIASKHLAKVFEPFFTTKPVGQGTGLGLAVSHGIATEHGGWIAVDSVVGQGSTFSVYLPMGAT
jgi:signal transduction histidine kinase